MATLKTLVDETTNIKNELKECYSNLKNNLVEKGVECSDSDKMSSLIDKVNELGDAPLYLYKEGDECIDITGGFEAITLRDNGKGSITNTKETTYLYTSVQCSQALPKFAGYSTKNKINLSAYSRLIFEYDYSCNTSEINNRFGVINDKTTSSNISIGDRFIASSSTTVVGNKIISSVDISSIKSSYYISYACGYNNSIQTIKMYNIWLEA